ncbi:hypothetical protein [Streptomyces sp. NPDC051173]|uniref:hypothetical protein n=1 Tax=Streptomyces sp. NPDC051173 TaxID=3155164 RepID=UPI00344FB7AA
MLTMETVRTNRHLDEDQAARVVELWNAAYPGMREILDTVIRVWREAGDDRVERLERVRRELGQMDRGTYQDCKRSAPVFIPSHSRGHLLAVLNVTSIGNPHAGAIHRLAAELADLTVARHERLRAETAARQPTSASAPAGAA